jgi:hypothetical protein
VSHGPHRTTLFIGVINPCSHTSHSFVRVLSHWYQSDAVAAIGFHRRSSTTPSHRWYWAEQDLRHHGPINLGHQIRVLCTTDFARSRRIGNLRPQIHWAPPLCLQAAHSTMSPKIHRVTWSLPSRPMLSIGGLMPWDTQRRGLDLCRAHHLRGGRHSWKGRRRKTCSLVGCIHTTLSAPMDPLHWRRPLTAMSIHPCSHTQRRTRWPAEIHRPQREYPHVPGVVTDPLEYCSGAMVCLQDWLSEVVTHWL